MNSDSQIKDYFLNAYDDYSDAIFRFCLVKTRNREVSQDIMQDTFIKTWGYLKKGKKIDMMRPFLYKIAYNLIIDFSRKKKNISLENYDNLDRNIIDKSHEKLISKVDSEIAINLLEKIPKKYRDLLIMRYVEELTLDEIEHITKIKKTTITVHIHRAKKIAKSLLEKYEK